LLLTVLTLLRNRCISRQLNNGICGAHHVSNSRRSLWSTAG